MSKIKRKVGHITPGGMIKTPKGWRAYSASAAKLCGLDYDEDFQLNKDWRQEQKQEEVVPQYYSSTDLKMHKLNDPVKGRSELTWQSANGVFMVRKTTAWKVSDLENKERVVAYQVFEHSVFVKSIREVSDHQKAIVEFLKDRRVIQPKEEPEVTSFRLERAIGFLNSRSFVDFEVDYVTGYGGVDYKGIDANVLREAAKQVTVNINESRE